MDLGQFIGKSSDRIINTPHMNIQENILSFKDYFIQISNIAQVSIDAAEKEKFSTLAIGSVLLGMMIFSMDILSEFILGIILTGLGGYALYKTYKRNMERGENLTIQLNSGSIFRINFKTRDFLNEVMEVLKYCANNKDYNATIDIQNSVVTLGNENQIEVEKHA